MCEDKTEPIRRKLVNQINAYPRTYEQLKETYGEVWDSGELMKDFDVEDFYAPFAVVRRIADGKRGVVTFQHYPRYYFNFQAEPEGNN